jgi:hypothetical protein
LSELRTDRDPVPDPREVFSGFSAKSSGRPWGSRSTPSPPTVENDLVVVRLLVTATVQGSLLGAPADGKPVRWDAVDIYRVTDGKISEEWAADDVAAITAQIGAFNPSWAA